MCPRDKREKRKERTRKVKISQRSGISKGFLIHSFHQNLGAGGTNSALFSLSLDLCRCRPAAALAVTAALSLSRKKFKACSLSRFPLREEVAGYEE